MAKSAWNGSGLPSLWLAQPTHCKQQVIAYLQGRTLMPPLWWSKMSNRERMDVTLHLCAIGAVSHSMTRVRVEGGIDALYATMMAYDSKSSYETLDESTTFKTFAARPQPYLRRDEAATIRMNLTPIAEGMLYPKPNGGKRILPSVYTKLTDRWLRANGVYQEPAKMNQGHLQNTVALLNESHVNLVDRMCDILGRMHNHLGNRPDMQAKIVDLFHDLEVLQVDELYPIVELLASHIEPKLQVNPADLVEDDSWIRDF